MKLTDRIEAKRKVVDDNDPSIEPICNMAYNEAIDDVIKIIKPLFEEKDQPDSEGLWFRNTSIVEVICDKDRGEGYLYRFLNYYDLNRASNNAKWVKVLVPESEE